MNLTEIYSGENEPFEGDLSLWLRSLPEGARASRATLTLKPVPPPGGSLFRETIRFNGSQGERGATLNSGSNFVEVDFHTRRTLLRAVGTGDNPTLQVDMGGAFLGVAEDGTFIANGAPPWTVDLSADTDNLPALTVTRFRLTEAGTGSGTLNLSQVDFRSTPSNLQVRLGQMPPFWVRLGELSQAATSPDFSEVLNFFLNDAAVENGFFQLPLVIHSETLARIEATLNITYVIERPVLPPHLSEVNLPYDFSTLPAAEEDLLMVRLPRGAIPVKGRNQASIRGAFEPSRIASGDPGESSSAGEVTVTPQCSQAQPIEAEQEISLSGIDLPLANTRPGFTGLNLSIVEDADGKPSGSVLATAEVKVGKPLPDGRVWGSATLPERFRILPGTRRWLVLQSRDGEAYWSVATGRSDLPTLQCSRDGGLSWRASGSTGLKPPLAGLFRLRHVPEQFTIPVQLQIGRGAGSVRRRLDEFAPAGKVEFSFDFSDRLEEHLRRPGIPPACDGRSVLCNPDFSLPRPQDATRRLFGRDAISSWRVESTVDLSRGINLSHERFIMLSVDGSPPRRIDCAGADPAHTRAEEIVAAINRGAGAKVAEITPLPASAATLKPGSSLQLVSPLGDYGTITLHPWCEKGLPECWEGSAARIYRLGRAHLHDERGGVALLLADENLIARGLQQGESVFRPACFAEKNPAPPDGAGAILRQRFTVSAECSYQLKLSHKTHAGANGDGNTCTPQALEAPSLEIEWFDAIGNSLQSESTHLEVNGADKTLIGAAPTEKRLCPPQNATQAELRLRHPAPANYGLVLNNLSLTASAQAVQNHDFSRWEQSSGQRVPAQWQLESGWTERALGRGVRLRGDGPEEALMIQSAAVTGDAVYRLQVQASSTAATTNSSGSSAAARRARLELVWKHQERSLGNPVSLTLDDPAFPTRGWQGPAPAEADQAELRLIQPQGAADLVVTEVRFEKQDMTEVPLTFLGESPGRLKISDLRIAYDLPEVETAPASAIQARSLLSAGQISGEVLRPAAAALADQPTAVISGVGKRYSEVLARHGVRTIGQLAAFEKEQIEGIHPARLIELRAAAELVLDSVAQVSVPDTIATHSVREIASRSSEELARLSGESTARARQLQRQLRAQLYLLDNKALEEMTLGALTTPRKVEKEKPPG